MDTTYHILSIFDYKGGELSAQLNLSYRDFLEQMAERVGLYEFIEESIEDGDLPEGDRNAQIDLLRKTDVVLDWINDRWSMYGGGENCYYLYECYNNHMIEMQLNIKLLDDIVNQYIKMEYI